MGLYGSFAIALAIGTMTLACAPAPSASAALIADHIHSSASDAKRSTGAVMTGEMTQLEMTESVEAVVGRPAAPGRLTGWLLLRNVSAGEIVRVIGVSIRFVDSGDRPMALGAGRRTTALQMATTQLSPEPLDPGEAVVQAVDVDLPTTKNLREVRFELSYVAAPASEGNYPLHDDREQTLRFVLPIAGR